MKQTVDLNQVNKTINKLLDNLNVDEDTYPYRLGSAHSFGDHVIDLNSVAGDYRLLRIRLNPTRKSKYWRAGIKFSPTPEPIGLPRREDADHPLFHLTCNDTPTSVLGVTYYHDGQEDKEASGVIVDNYSGGGVELYLYRSPATDDLVAAVKHKRKLIYARKLYEMSEFPKGNTKKSVRNPYRYAWLSSWGDMYNYELGCLVQVVYYKAEDFA